MDKFTENTFKFGAFSLVFLLAVINAVPHGERFEKTEMANVDKWTKGCAHNGAFYKEGSYIPTKEPCLNCTCHQGALRCHLQVCPHVHDLTPPPPGCVLVERKGACCPKLHCPEKESLPRLQRKDPSGKLSTWKIRNDLRRLLTKQLSRSASDKSGCMESGTLYADGSAMMTSSNCEYCFCLRGKQLCVKPRCAPPMAGCAPRYRALSCCPTHYDCSAETPLSTIGNHTATVVLDEVIGGPKSSAGTSTGMRANDRLIDLRLTQSHKENWQKESQRLRRDTQGEESDTTATTEVSQPIETTHSEDVVENARNPPSKDQRSEESAVITEADLHKDSIEVQVSSSVSTASEADQNKPSKQESTTKGDSGKILDSLLNVKNKAGKPKTQTKTTVTVSSSSSSSSSSSKTSSSSTTSSEKPAATATTTTTAATTTTTTTTARTTERLEPVTEQAPAVSIVDEDTFHIKSQVETATSDAAVAPKDQFSPPVATADFAPVGVASDEPKSSDYEDYDYRNMELPPSLPNLKIIPFVAADAVREPSLHSIDDDRLLLGVAEQRSPALHSKETEASTEAPTRKPAPVFTPTERPTSSPLLAFTVTFPPRPTSSSFAPTLPPRPSTTSTTIPTTTKKAKPQKSSANNLSGSSGFSAGLLRVDGCNIYGAMYSVGRIIEELSGPCIECRCTDTGVQCAPLTC